MAIFVSVDWLQVDYEYVDETQEIATYYSEDLDQDPQDAQISFSEPSALVPSAVQSTPNAAVGPPTPVETPRSYLCCDSTSPVKRRTDDWPSTFSIWAHGSPGEQSSIRLHSPHLSYDGDASRNPPGFNQDSTLDSLLSSTKTNNEPPSYAEDDLHSVDHEDVKQSYSVLGQHFWPLAVVQEACLMRYFIDDLASWFDLCDPGRHFALVIPQRAAHCPPLLNAIFTASARHLSRLKDFRNDGAIEYHLKSLPHLGFETAIQYHNQCINHLVSLSDDPREVLDENLLAAAVILRFYEEVDAPLTGGDPETGLRGIQIFIDAQAALAAEGNGLRHAAFRVGFRQEVYMAFMKQRSFAFPLDNLENSYRSFEPTDDYTWSHRAVVHCADVLMYCYGEGKNYNGAYDELLERNQRWMKLRPNSFSPIYYREPDAMKGEIFPDIWCLSDCHVTGVQHIDLARILLTVYNPRNPRLGPGSKAAVRKMEDEVKGIVLKLCGIALSNRKSPPALNTACIVIAMSGDHFSDRKEQNALLDILSETDTKYAWPTTTIRDHLKEAWGL